MTMKIKLMPLLAGVIALGITTTPLIAKAQSGFSNQPSPTQSSRHNEWDQLGLSDQQKEQILQLHRDTRAKIQSILTQEQRDQIQAAMQNGQGKNPQALQQITASITSDQKNQIRDLLQQEQSKIKDVLTPAQQQQWKQMREQRQQNNQ
jgi:hypothetical protein